MKKLNQIGAALLALNLIGTEIAKGQDSFSSINLSGLSDNGVLELSGTNIPSFKTFSDDELTALVGVLNDTPTVSTPTLSNGNTMGGTFWSLQNPGMPPLPSDTIGVDVWPMADGSFLLDDLDFDYNGISAGPMGMHAMDDGSPPFPGEGGGDGGTNYTPGGTPFVFDPGTNLWIAQWSVATNIATGIASNTVADIEYEMQWKTNLLQTNWASLGFIIGSETTNWTVLIPQIASTTNNGFLRLRSWQSSDGSSLPDWWELQYFGTNGVDPYGDPKGDGYNNFYKFEHGMNPNVFYPPSSPQNFTASYDPITGAVLLNWLPSAGAVTGYVIQKTDYQTGHTSTFTLSASSETYTDSIAGDTPEFGGPTLYVDYSLKAQFGSNGNSEEADATLEYGPAPEANLVTDSQGRISVVIPNPPNDLSNVVLFREQASYPVGGGLLGIYTYPFYSPIAGVSEPLSDGSFSISATSITNGVFQLPDSQFPPFFNYGLWMMTVRSNGLASSWTLLADPGDPESSSPFVDARQQLKDNLRFLLREGDYIPFSFSQQGNYYSSFTWPATDYVYSGFYGDGGIFYGAFAQFAPIEANYIYRNFIFDSGRLGTDGFLNTGVYSDMTDGLLLTNTPAYYFNVPGFLTNNMPIYPSLLATNQTRWLTLDEAAVSSFGGQTFDGGFVNCYGLTNLSAECAYVDTNGNHFTTTIYPNDHLPTNATGVLYYEYAQPQFVNDGYYFARPDLDQLPEGGSFASTNVTPLILQGVGTSQQIAGYAVLGIANGYSGEYTYLGQYFSGAYVADTNGNATATRTGILSPYGNFYATKPGQVALVTMPDIDTGAQGTCAVYCVSLQVDKNHDGTMDLSAGSPDLTSLGRPMVAWVNNRYIKPSNNGGYDKDLPLPLNNPTNANSYLGQISCVRDLENFFRLWICGTPSLPSSQGYVVTLSMSPIRGTPSISLYLSCETNGSTGYLTDTNAASDQINGLTFYNGSLWHYNQRIGIVSNGLSYTFPTGTFDTAGTTHLLFEGAGIGTGRLTLTITQNSNIVCQTSAFIDLHDEQDLFEDARSSEVALDPPPTTNSGAFNIDRYQTVQDPSEDKQVVIFVHGLNNTQYIYDDSNEEIFKRLYWEGYHGRYVAFRWPSPTWSFNPILTTTNQIFLLNYNQGEYVGWQSALGLKHYIDNLQTRFTNYGVNLMATSGGGVVAAEAIHLGAQVVNCAMVFASLPAEAFDGRNTNLIYSYIAGGLNTPDADSLGGYNNCFTNSQTRLINFYNDDDYANFTGPLNSAPLGSWEWIQKVTRPDRTFILPGWDYYFDGTNCFFETTDSDGFPLSTRMLTQDFEKKSFVARSRTKAIGAAGLKYPPYALTAGTISTNISVQDASLGFVGGAAFGAGRDEHSGEFTKPIQTAMPFYRALLDTAFDIRPSL